MNNEIKDWTGIIVSIMIPVMLVIGYIKCIVHLCNCDFSSATSYKAEIIYAIGTCTGLGTILGWFNFGI
jgi:hypothetical protein